MFDYRKVADQVRVMMESPIIAPAVSSTIFGYSKQQFEFKMRELLKKMGFEKGITKVEHEGKKMVLYFAVAGKARDFVTTFNNLMRQRAGGNVASVTTSFDKIKAPAGTNAVVRIDLTNVKAESFDEIEGILLAEALDPNVLGAELRAGLEKDFKRQESMFQKRGMSGAAGAFVNTRLAYLEIVDKWVASGAKVSDLPNIFIYEGGKFFFPSITRFYNKYKGKA